MQRTAEDSDDGWSSSDDGSADSIDDSGWSCFPYVEALQLAGHRERVLAIAFCPDGTKIATADGAALVCLWDAHSGRRLATLRGHREAAVATIFSPDGSLVASAARNGAAFKLWDTACVQRAETVNGHEGGVHALCFSPCGRRLATAAADSTAVLWDLRARVLSRAVRGNRTLHHEAPVLSVAFRSDGTWVATACAASAGGSLTLWDAQSGKKLQTLQSHRPRADLVHVAFVNAAGSLLTAAGQSSTWAVPAKQQRADRGPETAAGALELWEVKPAVELAMEAAAGDPGPLVWRELIDRTSNGERFTCDCHHGIAICPGPGATAIGGLSVQLAALGQNARQVLLMTLTWPPAASKRPTELAEIAHLPVGGDVSSAVATTAITFSSDGRALAVASGRRHRRGGNDGRGNDDREGKRHYGVSIWDTAASAPTTTNTAVQWSQRTASTANDSDDEGCFEGQPGQESEDEGLHYSATPVSPRRQISLGLGSRGGHRLSSHRLSSALPAVVPASGVAGTPPAGAAAMEFWRQLELFWAEHRRALRRQAIWADHAAAAVSEPAPPSYQRPVQVVGRGTNSSQRPAGSAGWAAGGAGRADRNGGRPAWVGGGGPRSAPTAAAVTAASVWGGPALADYRPPTHGRGGAASASRQLDDENDGGSWWDGRVSVAKVLEQAFGVHPGGFAAEAAATRAEAVVFEGRVVAARAAGQSWAAGLSTECSSATANAAAMREDRAVAARELQEAEELQAGLYTRLLATEEELESTQQQLSELEGTGRRMAALHAAEVGALRRQLALAAAASAAPGGGGTKERWQAELKSAGSDVSAGVPEHWRGRLAAAVHLLSELSGSVEHGAEHATEAGGRITTVTEMLRLCLDAEG